MPASAAEGSGGSFNDADVAFAQSMIVHHQQAVEMADLALDPASGAGAEVTDLAQRIKAAQAPEIALMSGWLDEWGVPATDDSSMGDDHGDHDDHDMGTTHGAAGMMSTGDMVQLMALRGPAFDQAWLEGMIEHHEGAITMAGQIKDDGDHPEVRMLADQVITTQQQEIDEMRTLLEG